MEIHDDDMDAMYVMAARRLLDTMHKMLQKNEHCVLGIVGGRAMPALFDAIEKQTITLPGTIHVFWLDERVSSEKNFTQALPHLEKLSEHFTIEWHPIVSTDKKSALAEADACMEKLRKLGGRFDVVVLSAGEDGHIASLFPGHPALRHQASTYLLVEQAPKPPPLRLTVTPPLLRTARQGFLFFVGKKKQAYANFKNPNVAVEDCPAKLLTAIPLDVFAALD